MEGGRKGEMISQNTKKDGKKGREGGRPTRNKDRKG